MTFTLVKGLEQQKNYSFQACEYTVTYLKIKIFLQKKQIIDKDIGFRGEQKKQTYVVIKLINI